MAQVREAAKALTGQSKVEIVLNPSELGSVKMTIATNDAGSSVALQVERPETLELVNRHLDMLRRELKNVGWSAASISLEASSAESGDLGGGELGFPVPQVLQDTDPTDFSAEIIAIPGAMSVGLAVDGLDIRL